MLPITGRSAPSGREMVKRFQLHRDINIVRTVSLSNLGNLNVRVLDAVDVIMLRHLTQGPGCVMAVLWIRVCMGLGIAIAIVALVILFFFVVTVRIRIARQENTFKAQGFATRNVKDPSKCPSTSLPTGAVERKGYTVNEC